MHLERVFLPFQGTEFVIRYICGKLKEMSHFGIPVETTFSNSLEDRALYTSIPTGDAIYLVAGASNLDKSSSRDRRTRKVFGRREVYASP